MPTLLTNLLNQQWVRYLLVLIAGVTIGALFYPTKHIEEQVSAKYEQQISSLKEQHAQELSSVHQSLDKSEADNKSYHEESQHKIDSLTTQITQLKSSMKTSHYKIVHPDGTIEERDYTDNEVDQSSKTVTSIREEFNQKIDSIEKKWSKIHEDKVAELKKQFDSKESDYKSTIATLQASKVETVNQKQFGLEVGMMTDKDWYAHATMDVWGPLFFGIQGEVRAPTDSDKAENFLGAGIGIRF